MFGWVRMGLVACVVLSGAASAEVQRPMDERATARLIVQEVARQAPGAKALISGATRFPFVSVTTKDGTFGLVATDLHPQLREAKDGTAREVVLRAFVAEGLAGLESAAKDAAVPSLDLASLMPMIRSPQDMGPQLTQISRVPFVADLFQCWATDSPGVWTACHYTWTVRSAGLGKLEITALGLRNLEARLDEVVDTVDGRVHQTTLGLHFAPSLMLLDSYWAERAGAGTLVAAIPTEEELYWIVDPDAADLADLRKRVLARHGAATRGEVLREPVTGNKTRTVAVQPLSPGLYRWTGSGWEVLAE